MKQFILASLFASAFFPNGAVFAWNVNNWTDRADAQTCSQLAQTASYYMSKYYATGNSQFKQLANDTNNKAKGNGCR